MRTQRLTSLALAYELKHAITAILFFLFSVVAKFILRLPNIFAATNQFVVVFVDAYFFGSSFFALNFFFTPLSITMSSMTMWGTNIVCGWG